jgi:hypothetical protein
MIAKLRDRIAALWYRADASPQFAVVCVRAPTDMTPETLSALQLSVSDFRPDWSTFLPPDLFLAFFTEVGRADGFSSKVRVEFSALRIGRAEGKATAEFGADGKLSRMPAGAFINEALRQSNV